ncbi:hypothetical protein [Hymenobacter cellulosivorans]|uniref:Outer membrane protein beta-barrel domain-containing protein n=1 Tax=Hymenobacter cellulosivorans TaxID=2932249 RepID=A0ABY4FDJ0_9BACT|nr:hypothetical protein [Hymenobacter cellulosivorans]UOQ54538.1 hypothetical protein MUN80_07180 [Hymenobacter cellulosivorans]
MKQLFTNILALLLVVSLVATEASAQQFSKRKQYNSVGVSINAMNYFGDIVPKASIPSLRFAATRPNIGVNFTHRFAPGFRLGLPSPMAASPATTRKLPTSRIQTLVSVTTAT